MGKFAHKLWAMGLPRRVFYTSRHDKKRVVSRLPRRAFCTSRHDKLFASNKNYGQEPRTSSGLSSRTQCGHLGFCHYERSEVIQKNKCCLQGDCFCHYVPSRVTRTVSKIRGQVRAQVVGDGIATPCILHVSP